MKFCRYKDDVPIEQGAKYSCSFNGEVAALEIENVDFQDQGLFTCLAENENGKAITSMSLEVLKEDQGRIYLRFEECF